MFAKYLKEKIKIIYSLLYLYKFYFMLSYIIVLFSLSDFVLLNTCIIIFFSLCIKHNFVVEKCEMYYINQHIL